IVATLVSALLIALWPTLLSIGFAEVLHAFAGSVIGPAIAALSLALVPPRLFGERLGRNARYAAIGNAFAAGLMGVCGSYFSDRAVFFLTAAFCLPALTALAMVRGQNPEPQRVAPATAPAVGRPWAFLKDRRLLPYFASP